MEADPMDEETGLLRVGNKVNKVKYVPSQETHVFRRVPSQNEAVDSTCEPPPGGTEVVEEVRKKQEKELIERMQRYQNEAKSTPPGSTYQRIGSDYSLNSVSDLFNIGGDAREEPTEKSRRIANVSIFVIAVLWTALCVLTIYGEECIARVDWWAILLICVLGCVIICFIVFIARQPKNRTKLIFQVPFVPCIPMASMMINIYLMLTLSSATWIRFAVWMALGKHGMPFAHLLKWCIYAKENQTTGEYQDCEKDNRDWETTSSFQCYA